MRRISFLIFLIIDQCINLFAQSIQPQVEFIKNYGGSNADFLSNFTFTKDGNIVFASLSSSDDDDISCNDNTPYAKGWLLKTDKQGNKLFSNCFGGVYKYDSTRGVGEYFQAISPAHDSGFIVACYTRSANILPTGSFPYACNDSANGFKEQSLIKYDKNGNIQWSHCYGGSQDDGIVSVEATADGGYIFLAQVRSSNGDVGFHYGDALTADSWLVKTDSVGNIIWKKVLGGTGYDYPGCVREVRRGVYITSICTSSQDNMLLNLTHYCNYDGWICEFDSIGNIIIRALFPGMVTIYL